ncbi:tRNA (adenosine(37)-N6)-dimethylallyltransferase MiaA [Facklamia miroungae]|uniref:tRNA dimethylallyltransferase n=1 Tax=Facklamia miroungae TaxID=120956 RepID=A0A1G7U388_9LACT|nr:tRNA (adenosine(37)-N6)-dimethylallyltransferase MiaA [Facklamia miroungae]SDG42036.1 tRNA dimethylallyltransferase [Facklamia miroungae]
MNKLPIVVIAGPTGVGKTALSVKMAKRFNGQVINADSMQVYRGLDIGTGKITLEEMEGVEHHLLDICHPEENYDASQFQKDASQVIKKIYEEGGLPFLVGGTGLYLEGLLYDLSFGGERSMDPQYRQSLEARLEREGASILWQELNAIDPLAAKKIPIQNGRRIIRALEVINQTGKLFSSQSEITNRQSRFKELLIILNRPREELYDRINRRVEMMLKQGLETEARHLFQGKENVNFSSMKGIGYKEWLPYFEEQQSYEDTVANIQQNSRRYAKRQLTWYRNRMKNQHWIDLSKPDYENQAEALISEFLDEIKKEKQ